MVLLDNRIGSADLTTYLTKWRVPHKLCRLDYGDCAFTGNGPDTSTVQVGVEIKRVKDALNCMTGGRFAAHQLPGLIQKYQYVWLVVEGLYTTDFDTGLLMERRGKKMVPIALGQRQFMYREFSSWLTTMEVRGGVKVRRTGGRLETARLIACLHGWWDKPWGEHKSHLAMEKCGDDVDQSILIKPNLTRRIAACLPGIGWSRSAAVARHFSNPLDMLCASVKEWQAVEGVGKGIAEKIQRALVEP